MIKKPHAPQTGKSQTKTPEESKKKTSLRKDNSWIRKDQSDQSLDSPDKTSTITSPTQTSSVQALSKRFSISHDELDSSRSPVKSDTPKIHSKTTVTEEPKTSITTTTVQDATKTTVTTTRTSVVKSPSKSEILTEKVLADAKATYDGSSVSKTEIMTVTISKETTNLELNNLDKSPASTLKTSMSTKTYTNDDYPTSETTSHTISSKSSAEDQLSDIPIPTSLTSAQPSPATRSDDYFSDTRVSNKTVSSTPDRYDRFSSVKSSSKTYTTYTDSRPEDYLSDTFTSKTVKSVYTTPERKVSEKDMCTYCHKPMQCETKMILEDINLKCHASCFKCEVCKSPMGHLKAGDTMWIYQRTVHCENCYGATREKWHR